MRKGAEVQHGTVQPKIEEKGGGKAVASEALDGVRERLPALSEKLDARVDGEPARAVRRRGCLRRRPRRGAAQTRTATPATAPLSKQDRADQIDATMVIVSVDNLVALRKRSAGST
jgi:hypothetical protein